MGICYPLAALFISLQAPAVPSGPLTLDDAVKLAERNAFSVRSQQATVEKQRQLLKAARGQLGPQLSGSLTYTRYPNAITTQFGSITVVEQPIDQQTGAMSLSLPIDISGNTRRLIAANKANYKSAQQTLDAAFNEARLTTRSAYLAVLRAMAAVKVDEEALKDAQERLKQAKQQYAQQEIAKVDLLAYETTESQSESDLLVARNNLDLARESLSYTLSLPIETVIQVVEVESLPELPTTVDSLVKAGQVGRPEVKAQEQTLVALHYVTRATESGLDPSLTAQVSLSSNFNPLPGSQATTYVGSLMLNVPLFDSGITRAKVKAARQDEVAAKVQLEQTRLGISQDVRAAITSITSAKARYDTAQAQVGYAQETYRLAVVKQNAGEGTYVEVIDAQNSLTQAKNTLLGARYDYLTAYAQLQRAVGVDDIAGVAKAPASGATK